MKPISLAEPVSDLRRIAILENGEPLVDFLRLPNVVLGEPRFDYRRETLLRRGVAERLAVAAASLPAGYRLAVIEGWRAPHIQRRLYAMVWNRMKAANPTWSDVRLRRLVNRFTAPMNARVPPPHTTGGAMDVDLLDGDGKPHDLVSPFERRDMKCFAFDAPGLSSLARHNRSVLAKSLVGAGITNYPSEFWHYSYGDQGWAYRGGHATALYGPITPENWTPDPRDDIEKALEFI
ncbi:MAG: M15 family metallopeptidase [Fimbriimonadaceae bacterium]